VQLRLKNAAILMLPPARRPSIPSIPSSGSGEAGAQRDMRAAPTDPASSAAVEEKASHGEEKAGSSGPSAEDDAGEDGVTALGSAVVGTDALSASMELPLVVADHMQQHLASYALLLLEGHPLADSVSESFLAQLSEQLAREIRGMGAAAFHAYFKHKFRMDELPESLYDGSIGAISGAEQGQRAVGPEEAKIAAMVREAVEHTSQVSAVHTELMALATLYLTYLHGRPAGGGGSSSGAEGVSDAAVEGPESAYSKSTAQSRDAEAAEDGTNGVGRGSQKSDADQSEPYVFSGSQPAAPASPVPRYMQAKSPRR